MAKPNSVVELLQALVRIPSVNPFALDSASQPYLGEGKCANFLAEFLQELRAEVVLEEIEPDRPNVIAHFPVDNPGKSKVLLGPHIDTVSIQGMTIDPFAAGIRDGKLYGRGAADTKGTMAAMLWALKELGPEAIAKLPVEVSFVGFMGEENNQLGSRHFAAHYPDYDFAVIGEPTEMDVVYTHKGTTWVQLIATGKSAHGSRPELGDNAILKLGRLLDHLDRTFQPILETFSHEVLGRSTMNIGQIRGGIQPNIVPDLATANLDFRLTPELAAEGLLDLLREQVPDEIEIKVSLECQPLNTNPDLPMVHALAAAGSGKKVGAPWFCDAAHLAAVGIPSVAAGPGSINQAHTEDEWISIESLEEGVNFYRGFLETC